MSSSTKKRLTLTRTSVKDKMIRLLDQILVTSDELRQMINRHIGAMPEVEAENLAAAVNAYNASSEQYPPPPIRIPGETRKKREAKGPEVSLLPEAASSPLAQNVKAAIESVQPPNPALDAELKKVTCPGGKAAWNSFVKRLAELLNQAGVSIQYDRLLEIAGPLYKIMCTNPIYVGTGRNGKPGVPFDPEQLAELQKGLERTQSLLRLSPEIMERIDAIAKGTSVSNLPPLSNTTVSLQRQRAALGITKRGMTKSKTRKAAKTAAAAAPSMLEPVAKEEEENQSGVSMLMPGAPSTNAASAANAASTATAAKDATAAPLNLGKRIPGQITKLQSGINSAMSTIQGLRNQVQVLGETVPRIKTAVGEYEKSSEKELQTLQTIRNQFTVISAMKPNTQQNKNMIKSMIKKTAGQLETARKMATAFSKTLAKVKAENLTNATTKRGLSALLSNATKTARNTTRSLKPVAEAKTKKTKRGVKITTPSGAVYAPGVNRSTAAKSSGVVYQPGANLSIGAVKPGPSNLPPNAATSTYNPFNSPPAKNNTTNKKFTYENTNEGQAYRKVQVKNPETGETGSYLMNSEGFLYDPTMDNSSGLNNAERESYMKGSYNKETGEAVFI